MACWAHSRLQRQGRCTPLQLLFGHEPELFESEHRRLSDWTTDRANTAFKAWIDADAESQVDRAHASPIMDTLAMRHAREILESRLTKIWPE